MSSELAKPSPASFTVEYDFDRDDLAAWHWNYYKSSRNFNRNRILQTVLFAVVLLCPVSVGILKYWTFSGAAFAYGFVAFFSVLMWLGHAQYARDAFRKHAADPLLAGGYGHIELTISEEGFREVTPITDSLVRWNGVTGTIENDGRIFIQLSTGQAAVINGRTYSGPVPFSELPVLIEEFRRRYCELP